MLHHSDVGCDDDILATEKQGRRKQKQAVLTRYNNIS